MSQLTISTNFYRLIRDQTIHNHIDALVELITNSVDAYQEVTVSRKPIDIFWSINKLTVVDQATGLSGSRMAECFLQVGKYTSKKGHRGFFSRGAKDISAIGTLYITSFYGGYLSQIEIKNDLTAKFLIMDQPIEKKDYQQYHIKAGNNGLHFQIELLKTYQLQKGIIQTNIEKLTNHFSLRGYFSDPEFVITSHFENTITRHVYQQPKGDLIVDISGNLSEDGYPGATYHFKLFMSSKPLGDPMLETDNRFIKFGVLVKSGHNIHDNGTLYPQIRYESSIPYIFGELTCDYINTLMDDLLVNELEKSLNPFPIIDSGRLNGINRQHPFTKLLFKAPYERMIYVLNDITGNQAEDSSLVLDDLGKLFTENEDFEINQYLKPVFGRFDEHLIKKIEKKLIVQSKQVIDNKKDLKYSQEKIKARFDDRQGDHKGKLKLIPKFTAKPHANNSDYEIIKSLTGYTIYISTASSLLKNYLSPDQHQFEFNSPPAKTLVADILSRAVSEILTNNYYQDKDDLTFTSFDLFNKNHHYYNKVKNKIYCNFIKLQIKE